MKRGFLNSPRAKKVNDAANPDVPRSPDGNNGGGDGATLTTSEDAMDVDVPPVEDASNTGNRVVAVRATRSIEGETKEPLPNDDSIVKGQDPNLNKATEEVVHMDDADDDTDDSAFPTRPLPRRPGWGRDPREDIFHMVPPSHGGPTKKRAVFRLWPRDPHGQVLKPSEKPRGKLSPDGYPWGATLYDIYSVNRVANDTFCLMTTMTGSALVEAMKEMGELSAARAEIEWAVSEGEPREEGVANTAELIESIERRLQMRSYHNASMREEVRKRVLPMNIVQEGLEEVDAPATKESGSGNVKTGDDDDHNKDVKECDKDPKGDDKDSNENAGDGKNEEDGDENGEENRDEKIENDVKATTDEKVEPIEPRPANTTPSTFDSDLYPAPWPFVPFENPLSILLQERIPLHLLPNTLHVHDPFSLLTALECWLSDTTWTSQPDTIYTYNLALDDSVCEGVEEARRKAEELEEFKARTLIILRYKRTKQQIENNEPAIEVPLPPYPRRLTNVEGSHLYISPVAKIGDGHHSVVYKGEWELPRDLFTRPTLCPSCFKESVDKEIQRLKDTGRWQQILNAAGLGSNGLTEPNQEEINAVSDSINLQRDGEIIEREITCIIPPDAPPMQIFEIVDESNIWEELMDNRSLNGAQLNFAEPKDDEDEDPSASTSEPANNAPAPTIRLDPAVAYERVRTCNHGPRPFPVPHTAKFTVVAKLSLQYDTHLAREAVNYQEFPEHFFHHYNGYTIISQLHTIVPVGAIVPQFYGYYKPTKESVARRGYLSPVLLLEHCGTPIDPEELTVEEQEECASLLLRFQRAGWIHESIAPRNFLIQLGKPTEPPIKRQSCPDPSFRLIDFGRSKKYAKAKEKQQEEMWALRMFLKLVGSMNVTLSL